MKTTSIFSPKHNPAQTGLGVKTCISAGYAAYKNVDDWLKAYVNSNDLLEDFRAGSEQACKGETACLLVNSAGFECAFKNELEVENLRNWGIWDSDTIKC